MSTDLVLRRTDVPAEFNRQMEMARVLADSTLLPVYLRGKPANVLLILQGARALDVSGFWALQSMHVIEGKLGMAAELMRALVIRAGHKVRIVERSMKRAVVEIQRSDRDKPYTAEFTWDDAVKAELVKRDNWRKYPKSMMVARATSIAVRDECPDVMFGVVYTPDELGEITDEDGAPTGDLAEAVVVDPLTDEEVLGFADLLGNGDLTEVAVSWQQVVDHLGTNDRVPETDQSLYDYLLTRLAIEAQTCNTKAAARNLWEVLNACRIPDEATVTIGGDEWSLRAYLKQAAKALPEEPEPAVPAEVDTEHARKLREEAEASWAEGQQRERENRERALAKLAEHRAEAAERLGRNLPAPSLTEDNPDFEGDPAQPSDGE